MVNKSMKFFLFFLSITFCLQASDYCGTSIIDIGKSMHRIRSVCGEPLSKEVIGEIKSINGNEEEKVYITEWVYDRQDKLLILTFHGSTLFKISKIDKH